MNKRAIIILTAMFLLIVGTLGFLLWNRSVGTSEQNNSSNQQNSENNQQGNAQDQTQNTNTTTDTTQQSNSSSSGPVKLLDDKVVSPVLFYKGTGISYFDNLGKFYQVDLSIADGVASVSNKKVVELAAKSSISKILWPATSNNFIAEIMVGGKKTWSFYDSSRRVYIDLPVQTSSLAWMPDATKIVYVWQGVNGKSTLNISNPDGTGYAKLADMYYGDSEISVAPDGKNILFYRTQNTAEQNAITLVSSDGKFFKTQVKDGYNLGVSWSPDSKNFVFGRRDALTQNYSLWLGNIQSEAVKNLNVNGSVEKLVWSKDGTTLYASSNMQGREVIYKITVATGEKSEIASGSSWVPSDMFLSADGGVLFFKNTADSALYAVKTTVASSGIGGNSSTNTTGGSTLPQ